VATSVGGSDCGDMGNWMRVPHFMIPARIPRFSLVVFLLASVIGCGGEANCSGDACADESASGSSDDSLGSVGESDSGSLSWPPQECSLEISPFLQVECLAAMRSACNAIEEEGDCTLTPFASFSNGGFEVRCEWAKVVKFSDVATCSVEGVLGRCEPTLNEMACVDSCLGEALVGSISAFPSDLELVQLCGGPLGSWSAVGSTEMYGFSCGDNLVPPEPAICQCIDEACGV
jgi:hypothetical protein